MINAANSDPFGIELTNKRFSSKRPEKQRAVRIDIYRAVTCGNSSRLMSGICGQFNLDSAPAAEADLQAMTAMLKQRGPDRADIWNHEHCGFGHTLLATTPELQYERQPFVHTETGCVITADVRLDNREELLAALGLSERRDTTGDAELILRAYLEWSDGCVDRLLGDFAFAIWDPRHRMLFCARDHLRYAATLLPLCARAALPVRFRRPSHPGTPASPVSNRRWPAR